MVMEQAVSWSERVEKRPAHQELVEGLTLEKPTNGRWSLMFQPDTPQALQWLLGPAR